MSLEKKYIPQILVHAFLWCVFYGLLLYPFMMNARPIPFDLTFKLLIATILFYLNYFYFVPKLLLDGHKVSYITLSILLLALVGFAVHTIFPPPFALSEFTALTHPMQAQRIGFWSFRIPLMPALNFGILYIFSTMLRLYGGWQKNEDLRKSIEKEKIKSELQFLKTQLNPHFLFNSLNTIYSLSIKKSADTAEAVINLSEQMRYMLYEADKDLVPLHKEMEYIKSYVALQRLRLANSEYVTLKISGSDSGKNIPPLLFISFIENAFKYGTDYNGKTMVKIKFSFKDDSIHFHVMNNIGNYKAKLKSSGVGLDNVKSRLNYLYPHSHELIINNDGDLYEVDLTLNI